MAGGISSRRPMRDGQLGVATLVSWMDWAKTALRSAASLVAIALFAAACGDTVTIPLSDSTPPRAELEVTFRSPGQSEETLVLHPDSVPADVIISQNDPLTLRARGWDEDGGISGFGLLTGVTVVCSGGALGGILEPAPLRPSGLGVGHEAPKSRSTTRTITPSEEYCGGGEVATLDLVAWVRVVNFHGGVTETAVANLRVTELTN